VVAEGPLAADGPWRLRSPPPYATKAGKRRRPMLAVTAAPPKTAFAVACVDGTTVAALKDTQGAAARRRGASSLPTDGTAAAERG